MELENTPLYTPNSYSSDGSNSNTTSVTPSELMLEGQNLDSDLNNGSTGKSFWQRVGDWFSRLWHGRNEHPINTYYKNIQPGQVGFDTSGHETAVKNTGGSTLNESDLVNQFKTMFDNLYNQYKSDKESSEQRARDWEEYMSSTAYQRAVEDMKKAGINPLVALGGSMGPASTPSSSGASYSMPNYGSLVSGAVSLTGQNKQLFSSLLRSLISLIGLFV